MSLRRTGPEFEKLWRRGRLLSLSILALCALSACGGTKVYTADKTVVYRDAIYNVSDVKVFRTFNQAVVAGQSAIDLKGMDKRRFNGLLDQHKTVLVRQGFNLDKQELVYRAQNVDSWSDFSRMNKQFESATKSMTGFIGSPKKNQLKLK
jgi:hypothetical protein